MVHCSPLQRRTTGGTGLFQPVARFSFPRCD
jgi:hypothetical protein